MQSPYEPYQSQYPQPPRYPPAGFTCPFCRATAPPITRSKVSTTGWALFLLLTISCFGIFLAWIGLLIREDYKVCSRCGVRIGGG